VQNLDLGILLATKITWPKTFLWRMNTDIQVHRLDLEIGLRPLDLTMTLLKTSGSVEKWSIDNLVTYSIGLKFGKAASFSYPLDQAITPAS
jgi:hypothetical protein